MLLHLVQYSQKRNKEEHFGKLVSASEYERRGKGLGGGGGGCVTNICNEAPFQI